MDKNNIIPTEVTSVETPLDIARAVAFAVDSKKAKDIKLLHVKDHTVITDYFVICTGTSRTQVRALADEADYILEQHGLSCLRTEGYDSGTWVLKDYGSVILHVFNEQNRAFYNLEKLYENTGEVTDAELVED